MTTSTVRASQARRRQRDRDAERLRVPSPASGKRTIDVRQHDLAGLWVKPSDALVAANDPPQLFRYGGLQIRIEHDDENCYTAQP